MHSRARRLRLAAPQRLLATCLVTAVGLAGALAGPGAPGASAGTASPQPAAASAAPAAANPAAAARLVRKINASRANKGLRKLRLSGDLSSAAVDRAQIMANEGTASHTPDLGGRLCCWTWLAENVGAAHSVRQVHRMFMHDAPHRANVLSKKPRQVGVAVVASNGTLWVVEVFRRPAG